jgi:multidrug efflux pump subunit AcrA (membrane-fusion protein)
MFRDRAIAAQSWDDSIDEQVRVVPLRGWLALALALIIMAGGALWLFAGQIVVMAEGPGTIVNAPGNLTVSAPVAGTLGGEQVTVGRRVDVGERVAVIDPGGGRAAIPVTATMDGVVVNVGPGPGSHVEVGELVAVIAPDSDTMVAYAFVSAVDAGELTPGPTAWLLPDNLDPTQVGYVRGRVAAVSPLPVPTSRIAAVLANPSLAQQVAAEGPTIEVLIALERDDNSPTGLAWTQPPGAQRPIASGTPAEASITVAEVPPYRAFFDG